MEGKPGAEKSTAKTVLLGCGLMALVLGALVVGLIVWLSTGPESGVKMANEMDQYAWEYLEEHNLLHETEELVSYYDATLSMDGSEAAILTTERVMYHKDGRTTAVDLKDIAGIEHRSEGLAGDIIEVKSKSGRRLKIEIALFNQGESFYKALRDGWEAARAEEESPGVASPQ